MRTKLPKIGIAVVLLVTAVAGAGRPGMGSHIPPGGPQMHFVIGGVMMHFVVAGTSVQDAGAVRVGDYVGFVAEGLPASTEAVVEIEDRPGSGSYVPVETTLPATITTDKDGKLLAAFMRVPAGEVGDYRVRVNAAGVRTSGNRLTIVPNISLSPDKGAVGTEVTISGTGFRKWSTITVGAGAAAGEVDTVAEIVATKVATDPIVPISDAKGGFSAIFKAMPGKGSINATDGLNAGAPVSFAFQPLNLTLEPAVGRVGDSFQAKGLGFTPGKSVTVRFLKGAVKVVEQVLTADAVGAFTLAMTVPEVPKDGAGVDNRVEAEDMETGARDTEDFVVVGKMTLSPTSGVPGTVVTINGKGFAMLEVVTVSVAGVKVITTPRDLFTDPNGSFAATFTFPALPPGEHDVVAATANSAGSAKFTVTGLTALRLPLPGGAWAVRLLGLLGREQAAASHRPPATLVVDTTARVGDYVGLGAEGLPAFTDAIVEIEDGPDSSSYVRVETTLPTTLTTDKDGKLLSAFMRVPAGEKGKYKVRLNATGVATSGNSLDIIPNISISPDKGAVGTMVTISGTGFKKSSAITVGAGAAAIDVDTMAEVLAAKIATDPSVITTDARGGFTAAFPISPGKGVINATDGLNVGPFKAFAFKALDLTLNPAVGRVGDSFQAKGVGFTPGKSVTVSFWTGMIKKAEQVVSADATGAFTLSMSVPEVPKTVAGVDNRVEAVDMETAARDTEDFVVTEKMSISPTSGPPGTPVAISGQGFAMLEVVTVSVAGFKVITTPKDLFTDPNGSFSATFQVPYGPAGRLEVKASTTNSERWVMFEVPAWASLTPPTVFGGGLFPLKVSGLTPATKVKFFWAGAEVQALFSDTGALNTLDTTGSGTFFLTVPEGTAPGIYEIMVRDAVDKTVSATMTIVSPAGPPAPLFRYIEEGMRIGVLILQPSLAPAPGALLQVNDSDSGAMLLSGNTDGYGFFALTVPRGIAPKWLTITSSQGAPYPSRLLVLKQGTLFLPGDVNTDGVVDVLDLVLLGREFGKRWSPD